MAVRSRSRGRGAKVGEGAAEGGQEGTDSMGLDVVVDEALLSMTATTKDGAIRDLVQALTRHGRVRKDGVEEVVEGVLRRESRGSTGIGNGLAVPHDKACPRVDQFVGVFGRSVEGIPYGSVDGEPVHLFFLLLSPGTLKDQHLDALKAIAGIGRDENFCRYLREAQGVREVKDLIQEAQRR
ncbi:MAG: PTS sugar transporter subunit IIA [Planctomycetes bacterium]|nr:PTS sugar transporter subunit IIA [Planctomycetota bacterium]